MLVSHSVWRSEDTCSLCVCVLCECWCLTVCGGQKTHAVCVCVLCECRCLTVCGGQKTHAGIDSLL
ncbi:hypothetical protein LEMLEM_LOCUS25925, partial [Lemmus lemmus]